MRTILFSILLVILIFPIAAENILPSLDQIIPDLSQNQINNLMTGEELVRPISHKISLTLTPTPMESNLHRIHKSMEKSFGIEALLFLPIDEYSDRENITLNIYNILRQIRTLEGQDYYSQSRGERTILFHQFFAIADLESRTPLADPHFEITPQKEEFYIFQEDATFGEGIYRMNYETEENTITLSLSNISDLWFKIIPIARENELVLTAQVIPTSEGILFYGLCQAEGNGIPGFNNKVTDSLKNRILAIFQWFSKSAKQL